MGFTLRKMLTGVARNAQLLLLLTAFLALILAAGCGKALSGNPGDVVSKAHAATIEVSSYRVEGTMAYASETETVDGSFEVEYVAPDRIRIKSSGGGGWSEAIFIGDMAYSRDSDHPDWRSQDGGFSVAVVLSPVAPQETLRLLQSLVDLQQLTDEEINGVNCLHYKGRVDVMALVDEQKARLDPSEPYYEQFLEALELQARSEVDVELWIGEGDYLIRQEKVDRQMLLISPGDSQDEEPSWAADTSTMRFFDFNEPITIEAPATEESWMRWREPLTNLGEVHDGRRIR